MNKFLKVYVNIGKNEISYEEIQDFDNGMTLKDVVREWENLESNEEIERIENVRINENEITWNSFEEIVSYFLLDEM